MTPEPLCACGCGAAAWRWSLSERCAHLLAGLCAGKTRFGSEVRAEQRRHRGQQTYPCPVCGYWHNGSGYAVTPELKVQQGEVVAGLRRRGYPLGQLAAGFAGMNRQRWKNRGEIAS